MRDPSKLRVVPGKRPDAVGNQHFPCVASDSSPVRRKAHVASSRWQVAKGVGTLLRTFVFALPSLVNIMGLIVLLFFLYALLGVRLFARVKHQEYINRSANMDSFLPAFSLMVRMSTGVWAAGAMHFSCGA